MGEKSSKVLYQSTVHGKTTPVDQVKKQYARAVKQVVDTLAPGFNPKRTQNRKVQE